MEAWKIVTFKEAVFICFTAPLITSAGAPAQHAQPGNAPNRTSPPTLPANSPLPADRLFAIVSPAVVKLTIKDEDDREISIASGFIVSFEKEKYDVQGQSVYRSTIITNYHVIRPAIRIDVSFSEGHTGWASEVIGEDESVDLAVLSVSSFVEPKRALKLHESPNPAIGTKVYAIGNPQGLSNTLSEGLISGYRQRGKYEPWIQITAPISPGSSGGPLFSAEGSVLGVTTAAFSESQNLNFAVPASEISQLLNQTDNPRPIWEGASIRETEEHAFLLVKFSFVKKYRQANPNGIPGGQSAQAFERFEEEQLASGDQLALLLKGRDLYFSGQYTEAIGMLERATKADSGEYAYLTYYVLAQAMRANIKLMRAIDLEEAVDPLKRAKKLNPEFGPTFYLLSTTYDLLGKYPEALVEAESLVRLMPRCYDGYQLRGEAWAELGREESFERDFAMACGLRPNDRDLLFAKAGGYVSLDKMQKASDTYKDVVKLDEGYWAAYANLGSANQSMGKYEEAIRSYQKALKVGGMSSSAQSEIERGIMQCRNLLRRSP